jgi:ribose transport system permease protein
VPAERGSTGALAVRGQAAADESNSKDQLAAPRDVGEFGPSVQSRILSALSPGRIGAFYVLIVVCIIFSIWVPDTFPKWATAKQIFESNAITAMAALTLVIPLASGVFDISVPYTMTLSGIFATYMMVDSGWSVVPSVILAIFVGILVGVVNGVVVVVAKIDALIGTLATGFVIQAVILWRSGDQLISGPQLASLDKIADNQWLFGLTLPVFYCVVLAFLIWLLLERTSTGRRVYATGFNVDAARLAGVRTARTRFLALVACATMAGIVGVVLAAQIGSGSPTAGNQYLLPAFAAVFVGATQFKPGHFNAWGTVLATVLLGTIITGLGLAGAPEWVQQLVSGIVLIAALGLTGLEVRRAGARKRLSTGAGEPDEEGTQPDTKSGSDSHIVNDRITEESTEQSVTTK